MPESHLMLALNKSQELAHKNADYPCMDTLTTVCA